MQGDKIRKLGGRMKQPQIIITRKTISDLELDFNKDASGLSDDEFIALLENSIKLLQSQLLSIEQSF